MSAFEIDSNISLFGDNSSDDYKPDTDDLSDSDRETFTELQPLQPYPQTDASLFGSVVSGISGAAGGPSDEDREYGDPCESRPTDGNSTYGQVREEPELLPNNDDVTINVESGNDLVGPSNETSRKKKFFAPKQKHSRKRKRNPDEWRRQKAANARQKGEAYTNYKGKRIAAKSVEENLCPQKCRLKCNEKFTAANRKAIFSQFYKLDINAKNALLFGSIKICPVKRMRKGAVKHKSATFKYVVTVDGKQILVCKNAFASLFCIGKKKIDLLQQSIKGGLPTPNLDKRGQHKNRPHKIDVQVVEYVRQHIALFPAEESHYSRSKNINKKYLSPLLSISKMHKLYREKCALDNVADTFYVKECTYRNVFVSEFNLSFGHPKSDTCSTCDAGEANAEHVQNYQEAYESLKADRKKVHNSDNLAYLTMDLQQTMPLPKLSTSKAFYLRQMWMYNFGTHIVTKEGDKAVMCSWTEDQAGRGSSEILSCLLTILELEESVKNKDHLIFWSDSCAGQNKNYLLICLYQYLIVKGIFKRIDHKFPEVGHTYLDSDRDFGRIEKNLRKHQNIYSPEEYREIIVKTSRKNKVIDMGQHFRETETLGQNLKLYNRKKDVNKNKINFRDSLKWIRVEEYGSYLFKTTYDEYTPFQKVNIYHKLSDTPCLNSQISIPRLLGKTGSLKQPKVENLRDQLMFIPDQYKWWYQNILDAYP